MESGIEVANNLAGAAALVNGLVLWPIVRSLQKTVNELKAAHQKPAGKRKNRNRK